MKIAACVVFFLLCVQAHFIDCVRILSVFSAPSPSHYIFGSALLKELAARGHNVTSVNLYPQKKPVENFRDVFIETNSNFLQGIVKEAEEGTSQARTYFSFMSDVFSLIEGLTKNIFEHPEFQALLNEEFDLIIIENMWTDALFGLGEHFNAPMVTVSTFGTMVGLDDVVGNTSPTSVIPNPMLSYTSEMTLFQRIHNFIINAETIFLNNWVNQPRQQAFYDKYFPNNKLSYDEARKDCSLYLLNQHFSLSYPRVYVPNVIEVGGLHIPHNPPALPDDMQKFLDSATDGAIYFSLGSNVKSKDIPLEKRNILLKVFRELKQKVLWKFEDPSLPGKPDNVFITPWAPQHSVLAHPNVKVFISHGGLLSTTESIFYNKVILGMPVFGDQMRNVGNVVSRGIAHFASYVDLNEAELKHALNELLHNPQYQDNMQRVSKLYHDKPMTAMETAIYWIEYVLRHHGAKHLRNAGVHMSISQYYSLDVLSILLGGAVFVAALVIFSIRKIISLVFGPKEKVKQKRG